MYFSQIRPAYYALNDVLCKLKVPHFAIRSQFQVTYINSSVLEGENLKTEAFIRAFQVVAREPERNF